MDLGHVHRHTGQLHLDDVNDGRLEDVQVDPFLVVCHHDRVVLVVGEPGRKTVGQVVFEQLVERDLPDVLDLLLGIISCIFLGLSLETQLVARAGIGGQIGDQLGAIPVLEHHFEALEQSFLVQDMIHEQLIDEDVNVEGDVVVDDLPVESLEESTQCLLQPRVGNVLAVDLINRLSESDVFDGESDTLSLVPTEGDSPDSRVVMLQTEAFDVTAQVLVHVVEHLESIQNFLLSLRVDLGLDDVLTDLGLVTLHEPDGRSESDSDLVPSLIRVMKDAAVIRQIPSLN